MRRFAFIVVLGVALGQMAGAEEKTCEVKGMECQNCVDMVTKDVCTDRYSTCTVELKDKAKHVGQIHVVTKDKLAAVDVKAMDAAVAKMNYSVGTCVDGAPKTQPQGATRKR